MITVQLNEPNFEYDIHSLVKAFYPQHDVLVKAMPREEFPESVFHLVVNYDRKNHMIDFKFFNIISRKLRKRMMQQKKKPLHRIMRIVQWKKK